MLTIFTSQGSLNTHISFTLSLSNMILPLSVLTLFSLLLLHLYIFIDTNVVRCLPFKVRTIEVLGEEIACVRLSGDPSDNQNALLLDLCSDLMSVTSNAPIVS
jgi:hypothetical protein